MCERLANVTAAQFDVTRSTCILFASAVAAKVEAKAPEAPKQVAADASKAASQAGQAVKVTLQQESLMW